MGRRQIDTPADVRMWSEEEHSPQFVERWFISLDRFDGPIGDGTPKLVEAVGDLQPGDQSAHTVCNDDHLPQGGVLGVGV